MNRKEKVKLRWRYGGMLFFAVMIPLVMRLAPEWRINYVQNALFSFFFSVIIWEGDTYIVNILRKRFPKMEQTQIRTITTVGATVLYTVGVIVAGLFLIAASYGVTIHDFPFWGIVGLGAFVTLVMGAIYESRYFFGMWKATLLEAERLKGEKVLSEYELLKQQVNPDFLFDSLHLIEELIEENEDTAIDFTEKLSQTYRYILQHKDEELVDLKTEVSFVQKYVSLLQYQLSQPFRVNWQIDESVHYQQVIPFSLQYVLSPVLASSNKNVLPQVTIATNDSGYLCLITESCNPAVFKIIEQSLLPLRRKYTYLTNQLVETNRTTPNTIEVRLPLLANI